MFWTWLWGTSGLLLSTPLTVCLAVLGEYVPSLGFFSVLLDDKAELTPIYASISDSSAPCVAKSEADGGSSRLRLRASKSSMRS